MSVPLSAENLAQLKAFVQLCIANPAILHQPELSFVKSFIEHFGGQVPPNKESDSSSEKCKEPEPEPEPESEESDLELDMTGVIEPDADEPQEMGDPSAEVTEEQMAESQAKRTEAISAFAEKDYEKAIQLYTEAILLNSQSALLYAKRGQVYLLLNKPNACIRDCNRALELNPDSAAAHKFRGRAYHLLGKFEEAANDLRLACKFDFDEQADEWLREVTPNARRIEEHKRKKERKLQEKLERERQEKLKKARESAKAHEEQSTRTSGPEPSQDSEKGFFQFLNDPEVFQALHDPDIAQAFKEVSSNPINILKYQSNPKIMAFINKMASKYGGAKGISEMMGAMPGFPGAGGTPPSAPKPNPQDDVGLD